MMKATPAPPLVVAEPDLLLQLLIVPLDAPAQFGLADEFGQGRLGRQGREPVLRGRGLALRPFDQDPLLGTGLRPPLIAMSRAHPHRRTARRQQPVRTSPPRDTLPGRLRQ